MDIRKVNDDEIDALLRRFAPIPSLHDICQVYGVYCEGYVKIGYAANLASRVGVFRTSCPFPVEAIFSQSAMRASAVVTEQLLHLHFGEHRHRGEWFKIEKTALQEIAKGIDRAIRWTQAAHSRLITQDADYIQTYQDFERANWRPEGAKVGLRGWGLKSKSIDLPNKTC